MAGLIRCPNGWMAHYSLCAAEAAPGFGSLMPTFAVDSGRSSCASGSDHAPCSDISCPLGWRKGGGEAGYCGKGIGGRPKSVGYVESLPAGMVPPTASRTLLPCSIRFACGCQVDIRLTWRLYRAT